MTMALGPANHGEGFEQRSLGSVLADDVKGDRYGDRAR